MAAKGILGTKLGMTQVFDEDSRIVPVTVVEAGPCTVAQVKTPDHDGYAAVQLAYGTRKHVDQPTRGHLAKADVASARVLAELRYGDDDELPSLGDTVECSAFAPGETIDVTGTSKGKGHTGVMKRHNFHGMGDGHGVKKKNRHPGSVGMAATPGRTLPGKKMAGRAGGERVTMQNLSVVDVDTEHGLILVSGAVPGANGSVVLIRSAVKGQQGEIQQPETADAQEGSEA